MPSQIHLALAIVVHCRKSVGLRPLLPEELKLIAFGDIYRQHTQDNDSIEAARKAHLLMENEVQKSL